MQNLSRTHFLTTHCFTSHDLILVATAIIQTIREIAKRILIFIQDLYLKVTQRLSSRQPPIQVTTKDDALPPSPAIRRPDSLDAKGVSKWEIDSKHSVISSQSPGIQGPPDFDSLIVNNK